MQKTVDGLIGGLILGFAPGAAYLVATGIVTGSGLILLLLFAAVVLGIYAGVRQPFWRN